VGGKRNHETFDDLTDKEKPKTSGGRRARVAVWLKVRRMKSLLLPAFNKKQRPVKAHGRKNKKNTRKGRSSGMKAKTPGEELEAVWTLNRPLH